MSETQVTVVAKIKAKEGMQEQVKAELSALLAPTRAEEGCLGYDLHQSADDPASFLFYENWAGPEALGAHAKSAHLLGFRDKAKDLLAAPLEVSLWKIVK